MWKTVASLVIGGFIFASVASGVGANPIGAAMGAFFFFWLPAIIVFLVSLMAALAPPSRKPHTDAGQVLRGRDIPGQCPNCEATISVTSKECPHCHALFNDGASWKIAPL